QADGGRYVARTDPHAAERALGTIAGTGRESLIELRRMLGVLRSPEDPVDHRPQPKATDIAELVASVRAAGLPVEYRPPAWLEELPEGQSLAIYRVVQEALTNTLKHAGPDARSTVSISDSGTELLVEIVDRDPQVRARDVGVHASDMVSGAATGSVPASDAERPGSGIEGMKERVALYSGTVDAGCEGSGFAGRARFPRQEAGAAPGATRGRVPAEEERQ